MLFFFNLNEYERIENKTFLDNNRRQSLGLYKLQLPISTSVRKYACLTFSNHCLSLKNYINKELFDTNQCFHFTSNGTKICLVQIWWPLGMFLPNPMNFTLVSIKRMLILSKNKYYLHIPKNEWLRL